MSVALNISGSDLQPGVFWLGKLPSDWRVKRLKFSVRLVSAKAAYGESDLPYTGLEHIEPWTGRYMEDEEASPDGVVSHFEPGDVLFGKLRPYLAKVHLAQHRGVCSTEALVLRAAEELLPEYLRYFLVAPVTIEHINSSTYGSKMPRASWDFIGDQLQPLPPLDQQQKIAAFLNRKTAEIDTLIAKKRRLLDRLAEKRTSLITRAVTKGLNPDAPMKDSGIEWLGEIPAHWDVRSIRRVSSRVRTGSTPPSTGADYFCDEGIDWYTPGDISDDIALGRATKRLSVDAVDDGVCRLFPPNSVLIVGIGATLGKIAVATREFSANQQINVVLTLPIVDHRYLAYYLYSRRAELKMMSAASTLGIINQERTKQFPCPTPPLQEQREIAEYCRGKITEAADTERKIDAAIERLEEYRSALITNAVTGQIKVA